MHLEILLVYVVKIIKVLQPGHATQLLIIINDTIVSFLFIHIYVQKKGKTSGSAQVQGSIVF